GERLQVRVLPSAERAPGGPDLDDHRRAVVEVRGRKLRAVEQHDVAPLDAVADLRGLALRRARRRRTGREAAEDGGQAAERRAASGHWLTGEAGSTSSATTSRICCSVSTPLWPNRGMFEHAL